MDDPKAAAREALDRLNPAIPCQCSPAECQNCADYRTLRAYIARLERQQGEVVGTLTVRSIEGLPYANIATIGDVDVLKVTWPVGTYKIATIPEQSDD